MKIVNVKYLSDYKLEVLFSNNKTNIADFEHFLRNSKNESITKFTDKRKFKKVTIDTGFLSWNDGEMEISAQSVYDEFCCIENDFRKGIRAMKAGRVKPINELLK